MVKIPKLSNEQILNSFRSQYGYLKKLGLKIESIATLMDDYKVISVSHPFIFDNRLLPKEFKGIDVRAGVNETDLPIEFQIDDKSPRWYTKEYRWAPERYEIFVDRCFDEIREKLGSPNMTRNEMLDALCFGNFEEHKNKCIAREKEGKIPAWKQTKE